MVQVSDDELRRNAREIAAGKLGFYVHLGGYVVVNSLIFLAWWFSGALYIWVFPWFVFPLLGWGAGVLVHYICVFPPDSKYMEVKTEEEFQKLKRMKESRQEKAAKF